MTIGKSRWGRARPFTPGARDDDVIGDGVGPSDGSFAIGRVPLFVIAGRFHRRLQPGARLRVGARRPGAAANFRPFLSDSTSRARRKTILKHSIFANFREFSRNLAKIRKFNF